MPKITITNTKGLVQESGSGGVKVLHSSVSGSAGVEGLRVSAAGASGFLHMVQGAVTLEGATTATTVTNLLPAGSTVLCGEITITSAAGMGNITSVGFLGDLDALSGTIAIAGTAVGNSGLLSPNALIPAAIDNSDSAASVVITHDNLMAGPVGCTINLLCATAATTEG